MAGLDEAERAGYYFHWVFPLATVNFMPDGLFMFAVRPLGPELTESNFMWWFPPAKSFQERLLQGALVNFGHLVNNEDYEICEHAQNGMRSSVYRQGRYSAEQEVCLHHFHQLLTNHMRPHLAEWEQRRADGHAMANGNGNGHAHAIGNEVAR